MWEKNYTGISEEIKEGGQWSQKSRVIKGISTDDR